METMASSTRIQDLRHFVGVYGSLRKIAKTIHRLDENACNYGLSKAQETRQQNLINRADDLADSIGLFIYHQSDPRGCSLYLVDSKDADSNYTDGIAVV